MSPTLTVVIPVFNQALELPRTIQALELAATASSFETDVIVVDDGSSDGSAAAASQAARRLPLRVVQQANAGRLEARRTGIAAATGDLVLLLDSRVLLYPDSLAFAEAQVAAGVDVWNAHVEIETRDNPYALFWDVLTRQAFSHYFREPRTTSFDATEFDRFPTGTTCFLAPRALLVDAFALETTRYADPRHANDDTPLLRHLSSQRRIGISPGFRCTYLARGTLRGFARHALHRGVVFLDGHATRESRFFPAVVAFYPLSVLAIASAARRPARVALPFAVASAAGAALAVLDGRPRAVPTMALLAPVYALAHGAGMWRGVALACSARAGRR